MMRRCRLWVFGVGIVLSAAATTTLMAFEALRRGEADSMRSALLTPQVRQRPTAPPMSPFQIARRDPADARRRRGQTSPPGHGVADASIDYGAARRTGPPGSDAGTGLGRMLAEWSNRQSTQALP